MLYLKVKEGKGSSILTERQLRAQLPDVILPKDITDESLEGLGFVLLHPVDPPADLLEDRYHRYAFSFKETKDGWVRTVVLEKVEEDEIEAREGRVAASVRDKRDRLLAETDWTQMPDVDKKVSGKWKAYRQALRDLSGQEKFPFQLQWPDKPE